MGAGLRDPVLAILLLAGIFDGLAGDPIHCLVLVTTALALGWRSGRRTPEPAGIEAAPVAPSVPAPPASVRRTRLALTACAVAYAFLVGFYPRYSLPMSLAVLLPAATAVVVAWRPPPPRPRPPDVDTGGVLAWVGVFVALALWELTNLLLQPSLTTDSYRHPTISVLTDPFLTSHPGRSIGLFAWLALGAFLYRR